MGTVLGTTVSRNGNVRRNSVDVIFWDNVHILFVSLRKRFVLCAEI